MFKCQADKCKYRGKAGEAPTKVVTETRKKTYENVIVRGKKVFTVRSEGTEIVKEVHVCRSCADKIAS